MSWKGGFVDRRLRDKHPALQGKQFPSFSAGHQNDPK
jgi:hypothetical protein